MKWRSNKNIHDCGIYVLKHMECYHGEKESEWDCGLKLEDVSYFQFKLQVYSFFFPAHEIIYFRTFQYIFQNMIHKNLQKT